MPPHPSRWAFSSEMEAELLMFSKITMSAHWWICSSAEISWLNLRIQEGQEISFGSRNSFPSNPASRPQGKLPCQSALLSLGCSALKSWIFSDPVLRLNVQLEFLCAFTVFQWIKLREPAAAKKCIGPFTELPHGSLFAMPRFSLNRALGSNRWISW